MVPLEARIALQDLISQYVYGMDTGDADYVVSLFVPGAECTDVTGRRWDRAEGGIAGFTRHFLTRPHKRGGQHYFQIVKIEKLANAASDTYSVRSFWSWYKWDKKEHEHPSLRMLGLYSHTIGRIKDKWLILDMCIEPWVTGDPAT